MDAYIQSLYDKKNRAYRLGLNGYEIDNADTRKPASFYIGSTLIARHPVNLMSAASDSSTLLKAFPKGAQVGVIYSYVLRDGQIWWSVDWFSGKHAGFVKHEPGLFDTEVAEQTASGTAIETAKKEEAKKEAESIGAVTERAAKSVITGAGDIVTGVGKTLSALGGNLKWIILGVLLIAISAYVLSKKVA